jgi:hypothetical protein
MGGGFGDVLGGFARKSFSLVRAWSGVLKGALGTLNLDPPMILLVVVTVRRVGPGQARFAGTGRAAPGAHPQGAVPEWRFGTAAMS